MFRGLSKLLSVYFLGFSFVLFIPLFVGLYYQFIESDIHHEPYTAVYFLISIVITLLLSLITYQFGKNVETKIYRREGLAAVVLIWFITPALSCLPFLLSGTLTNPYQAYFELTSGFTTTGSTVLQAKKFNEMGQEIPIRTVVKGVHDTEYVYFGTVDPVINDKGEFIKTGIEAVSKGLLFWRSFSQWLGGMGVIVLFVAILPFLGVGGKVLYQAEVPGLSKEGMTPRIKETAIHLWRIYVILTGFQILTLWIFHPELDFFDNITLTFATLSTGGFSIKNESIAAYNSLSIEVIIMIFMFLGSLKFSLYYYSFRGQLYKINDREFFLHAALVLLFSLGISFLIYGSPMVNMEGNLAGYFDYKTSLRYGFFQSISSQTSTGFVNSNFNVWPYLPQVLLIIVMFIGGMSGSTAGGMKTIRHFILFKITQFKVESLFRPNKVRSLQIGGLSADANSVTLVLVFFFVTIFFSVLGTVLYVADGIDLETAFSLVVCMQNNVGLAFRAAGPLNSCAFMSDFSLALSSFLMILGRLEYLAVLAILVPAFWKDT